MSQPYEPSEHSYPARSAASLPVISNINPPQRAMNQQSPPPAFVQTAPVDDSPADPAIAKKLLEGQVIAAIQTVYDPEIPVNIWELGLIYGIAIDEERNVKVTMTLTTPACPVAGSLPGEVEKKIEAIPEVASAEVNIVWEPTWSKDRMSEAAMLQLGM